MTARVLPFPHRRDDHHGNICVMGNTDSGFQVAHESSSGNSWDNFAEYRTAQEAIIAAQALNRNEYGGECNVFVCNVAVRDACPGVGLPSVVGDF